MVPKKKTLEYSENDACILDHRMVLKENPNDTTTEITSNKGQPRVDHILVRSRLRTDHVTGISAVGFIGVHRI